MISKRHSSVPELLATLDEDVIDALEAGTIRLVSTSYLLSRPDDYRIQRHQELCKVEGALIEPTKAAHLMRVAQRRVLVLSYGWLSSGEPDPFNKRMEAVKLALQSLKMQGALHADAGLFWDYASLPQKPRTAEEDDRFRAGIGLMAHLYASPLGTTVLQCKEVPIRPRSEVGALRILRLPTGCANKPALRRAYERFGALKDVFLHGEDEATLRFESRMSALKALRFDPKALGLGKEAFACHEYNDRAYDDRGW